ncbi:MAG TPA: hypothetical protein VGC15_06545 [Acetobacteraceae bacterium]
MPPGSLTTTEVTGTDEKAASLASDWPLPARLDAVMEPGDAVPLKAVAVNEWLLSVSKSPALMVKPAVGAEKAIWMAADAL